MLSLSMVRGDGEGNGCRELGEVLSSDKVPSLQNLWLEWHIDSSLQAFTEGLGVGSLSPHLIVDLSLVPVIFEDNEGLTTAAVRAVAALIRERKVPGLWKMEVADFNRVGEAAYDLGAALTGGGGRVGVPVVSLQSFEELDFGLKLESETGLVSALFRGVASGRGSLPSLHTISVPDFFPSDVPAAHPLSECITKGKFPRLRNLDAYIRREGMHLALCSLHAKSLRSLTVSGKLRPLRSLELPSGPPDNDDATAAFCQALSAEKLLELRCLKLGRVNDAVLKKMVKAWGDVTPPPLEKLDLSGTAVGDEGVLALIGLAGAGRVPLLGDVRVGKSLSSSMQTVLKNFFQCTL
uniref:Uncharacterized protein n=1 Tax=Chromera velia CCMP2878 TaxID=1169474 RepID=A0A0G4HB48_9ALVE|eukprot:Cvel_6152.t1-p1 / transcript=Cvel_6152.t1 / gene=Cvel_6152 / organism=Chromera_velia_CCMP2878 / gene_product=hypothetical protein / transcript_product=hypothetical protein / location=Cvel_scaffold297:84325-85544(-) / protein_length=350 / sequence_SO=supercontig / SO=protein_coding / is_pseudo=false